MRILSRVAVVMVHAMHNGIRTRTQKRRALEKPGTEKEEPLPERRHRKLFMCTITMKEEAMKK
jgi:hypothetical protein